MKLVRILMLIGLCGLADGFVPSAQAQLFGGRRESADARARSWVIADATSGVVLDSANANARVQIGSITKVATAMVVMDWASANGGDLGELATAPAHIAQLSSPNDIGLQPGDRISLRDALYAALMQSDNQAAETLACHVGSRLRGGSEREASDFFVAQMNALARKLGMRNTQFLNPHGLDDLERKLPYSTAADVAILANYAIGHAGFTFYTSQRERRVTWITVGGEQSGAQIKNTNELLGTAGVDGVKTGTTRKAGPCVVISTARRPENRQQGEQQIITPRRLTIVVLDSQARFEVARQLIDQGWALQDAWASAGRPMKGWRK